MEPHESRDRDGLDLYRCRSRFSCLLLLAGSHVDAGIRSTQQQSEDSPYRRPVACLRHRPLVCVQSENTVIMQEDQTCHRREAERFLKRDDQNTHSSTLNHILESLANLVRRSSYSSLVISPAAYLCCSS